MNYNNAFKKVACCLTIPMLTATVSLTGQKPASALSISSSIPSYGTSYDTSAAAPTIPFATPTIISRYAVYSFRLTNRKSRSIHYFYVSPTNVDSWEEDVLGRYTLSPGESIRVSIDDGRGSCLYDFKAVFSDGSTSTDYGVNICDLSAYTL